jgi:hypothetical protein
MEVLPIQTGISAQVGAVTKGRRESEIAHAETVVVNVLKVGTARLWHRQGYGDAE